MNMSMARGSETSKREKVTVALPAVTKKSSKSRSFHFRYLELCRHKNITPIQTLRPDSSSNTNLDLQCDKLGVSEFMLIIEALHHDLVLQSVSVRMRRSNGNNIVLPIDSENRARLFRQKPVIYTRFIFSSLVAAIANCVKLNKNLTVLKLEGLPLQDGYIETVAKALASNDCLKEVSFQKSYIGDKGCEAVCSTVKYLNHVEIFNVAECNLSSKGAEHVADMIKMQKITRFSEGWEKSLRYRAVDIDSISGLRNISLANNPNVGDDGLLPIVEVLKEDAWVKSLDFENCGLTDIGANIILECLNLNNAITEFNIRLNDGMSKFLMRQIRDQLGKEDEEKLNEPQYDLSCVNGIQSLPKNQKITISQLLTHTKNLEEQLSFERTLRKKAEKLNEKLNQRLMENAAHLHPQEKPMPKGYVLMKTDSMQSSMKHGQHYPPQHFSHLVNSAASSPEMTPRSENATLRKQQELQLQLQQQQHQQQMRAESNHQQIIREEEERYRIEIDQQKQRQLMQVRKVRSEMKYVETKIKDKKRESKSDHEFANERDFKLNPNVHFEMDIGDSVVVNQHQRYEYCEDGADNVEHCSNYDEYNQQNGGDYIGDGVGIDARKHNSKSQKRYGDTGNTNSHLAVYMAELERKINNNKSGKKRHKSKNPATNDSPTNQAYLEVDSYVMDNMQQDSVANESDSDEKSESTTRGSNGSQNSNNYSPSQMKVFMRRTHFDDEQMESQQQQQQQDNEGENMSPRSAYLEIQRKKGDK